MLKIRIIVVAILLMAVAMAAFGQQSAAELVQRYNAMARDAELLAQDSRYADEKTINLVNSIQSRYSSLGRDYQNYIANGGSFSDSQTQAILAASKRIERAAQQALVNIQDGAQTRPRQWQMVVTYKLNEYDFQTSYEIVNVSAATLEEAKEKAKRSVKLQHNWAVIVDAYQR